MSFEQRLNQIIEKYHGLNKRLSDVSKIDRNELVKFAKEQSELERVVAVAEQYKSKCEEYEELQKIIDDKGADPEFRTMAENDINSVQKEKDKLSHAIRILLLPKDVNDEKDAILEIRAGTGGEEAALFVAVLLQMYMRYAEKKGWKFELISAMETGLNGYKEVSASVSGHGAFARLKFESGVHRVQRIPETESNGRIHTSAATVAVLPAVEAVDIHIDEKDLRIDVYRSSGAGGQHVNTTDSAVRVTHIPTNTVVCVQDGRSQHKNKEKAMQVLRSRVYEAEMAKKASERSAMRKGQVGSGDRSERIRTYNYPQGRMTDHRINFTVYSLQKILQEGDIDDFIERLIADDQSEKLARVEEN
jgi:peptide chain release factor 1